MRRKLVSVVSAIVLAAGIAVDGVAETSAEDAAKYRQHIMKALSGHAGAISMTVRGLAGNAQHASKHAESMSALGTELGTLFQEGSNVEDSEALPEIWEDPEEFAEALTNAEEALAALGEAATDNDLEAMGRAFRDVGKACKGCHERFREEHDH